jgi:predicted NAD/FAD-binding protein
VGIVGAGISGISAGVLLPAKVPGIDLTIYEKNNDVVSKTAICWQIKIANFPGRNVGGKYL